MQIHFWDELQSEIQRELDDTSPPDTAPRICHAIRGMIVRAAYNGTAADIAADMMRDALEN